MHQSQNHVRVHINHYFAFNTCSIFLIILLLFSGCWLLLLHLGKIIRERHSTIKEAVLTYLLF